MTFTSNTVLFFHLVFVFLSIGAFSWQFRAFVLRTSFWVTVTTGEVLSAVSSGKTQAEELIEIPLLTIILVTVFMIAGRRAKAQTQIQSLNVELEQQIIELAVSNKELADYTYQLKQTQSQIIQAAVERKQAEEMLLRVEAAETAKLELEKEIIERRRAEKALRKSKEDISNALEKEKELGELKSRFVTTTSHEFRTPLATILSSTELLEHYSHKWSEEKKLTHFQRIQTSIKHMTGLLNDVLLIEKAEADKLEFQPTPLALAQFCRDLVEEMQLTASDHTIAFCSQGQYPNTYMDEKLLRHILSNLLSNAIKYSSKASIVHFDLICEQDKAVFQIKDQGIGIPVADQDKLFNSFHRASNVGTISGTGLGLAIVKKSVDLHGGNITVDSEVGVGTTFSVMLPLKK